jgi:hypothetical protein
MKEFKYTILYCVCENFFDSILLRFLFRFRNRNYLPGTVPVRTVINLRLVSATANSYGLWSYDSGSATLPDRYRNRNGTNGTRVKFVCQGECMKLNVPKYGT